MAINITPSQAAQMTVRELHAKSHQQAIAGELGRRLALIDDAMNAYGGGFMHDRELGPEELTRILDKIENILTNAKDTRL